MQRHRLCEGQAGGGKIAGTDPQGGVCGRVRNGLRNGTVRLFKTAVGNAAGFGVKKFPSGRPIHESHTALVHRGKVILLADVALLRGESRQHRDTIRAGAGACRIW